MWPWSGVCPILWGMDSLNAKMTRREAVAAVAAVALAAPLTGMAAPSDASKKKGWAGGDPALHKQFGAHWYYT